MDRAMSGRTWVTGLAVGALLGAAVLIAPVSTYPVAGLGGGQVFSEAAVVRQIRSGSVLLAYPYPVFPEDQAMLWQALSNLRFSLIGGYVVRPLPNGTGTEVPPLLSAPGRPFILARHRGQKSRLRAPNGRLLTAQKISYGNS